MSFVSLVFMELIVPSGIAMSIAIRPRLMERATMPTSGERIEHLDSSSTEISRISGDDDQVMDERGGRNQAVFDGYRLAGAAQIGEQLRPTQTDFRGPRQAGEFGHSLFEPAFQPPAALASGQQ